MFVIIKQEKSWEEFATYHFHDIFVIRAHILIGEREEFQKIWSMTTKKLYHEDTTCFILCFCTGSSPCCVPKDVGLVKFI